MIITAIVVPTPKRISKKIKRKLTGDEAFLYGLIGGGIGLIGMSDLEGKTIPIIGLAYCGFAYSFLRSLDDEVLERALKDYNGFGKMY